MKFTKIAASRCHILKLKCTKFDFGCALPTPLGELTNTLAGFKEPTSKGKEEEGWEGRKVKRRR